MSDKVLCEKQDLVTIANAVREAADITDNFNVPSLVEKTCEVLAEGGAKLLPDLNAVNGGTAATTMTEAVDNAEAHASSQEALIAQIASALEGKAASGGGGYDVPTCHFSVVNGSILCATVFENGVFSIAQHNIGEVTSLNNVVNGTVVYVHIDNMINLWQSTLNGCSFAHEASYTEQQETGIVIHSDATIAKCYFANSNGTPGLDADPA